MQATYESYFSVLVASYNKSDTRMDRPHLRSKGPQSNLCFYIYTSSSASNATSDRDDGNRDGSWDIGHYKPRLSEIIKINFGLP
jgi:hypothetical protein